MNGKKILLVDDEPGILLGLGDQLEAEGYEVETAADGEQGYAVARNTKPDLIVLDVLMPKLNGFQICRRLRAEGVDTPILFLSAKSDETDIVLGLGFGADDYVTKPFNLREVVARIEAILRRAAANDGPGKGDDNSKIERLEFGDVVMDFRRFEATKGSKPLTLTTREFQIMRLFGEHPGEVITRDEFLSRVWGQDVTVTYRSVDNQIYGIRLKIEDDPHQPRYIRSIRGMGYKLVPAGDVE